MMCMFISKNRKTASAIKTSMASLGFDRDDTLQHITEAYRNLERGFEEEDQAVRGLQALLISVEESASSAFDNEDVTWIQDALQARMTKRDWYRTELSTRKNKYESNYVSLQRIVDTRRRTLVDMEDVHQVLTSNPELKAKLVKKQADLVALMEKYKAKLTLEDSTKK